MGHDRKGRASADDGISLVEVIFVSALFMVVLGVISAVLWSALRTTTGAQQESNALEEARVAMTQLERDIRGTLHDFSGDFLCNLPDAPTGYCLQLQIQRPDRSTEYVRYRLEGDTLFRDRDCGPSFSTCTNSQEMTDTLLNRTLSPAVTAFACDASGDSPEIKVDLIVGPLQTIGNDQGRLHLDTAVSPRNPLATC